MDSLKALKRLFSSGVRVRALSHLYLHPGESVHVRRLAHELGESPGNLARELGNLEKAGILRSETVGNQRRYSADPSCPIDAEMRRIFIKMTGALASMRAELERVPAVEAALVFGSFAKGTAGPHSDVDLMIVGSASDRVLAPVVSRIERALGRDINYTVFSREEVSRRRGQPGDFVHEVLNGPTLALLGSVDG